MNLLQPLPLCRASHAVADALVATLDEPGAASGCVLSRLPDEVSWLQVRADRVGDVPPGWLRQVFGGKLLYTLRSGDGQADDLNRSRRLIAAASEGYDLIELDGERDIDSDLLAAIPPEQRLISWRGAPASASELTLRFHRLSSIAARSYLFVVEARRQRMPWRRCYSFDRPGARTSQPMPTARWGCGAVYSPLIWVRRLSSSGVRERARGRRMARTRNG